MVDGPMAGHGPTEATNVVGRAANRWAYKNFQVNSRSPHARASWQFAANDLDSQLIMRVIPALRRTERKIGHAPGAKGPAELAWGHRDCGWLLNAGYIDGYTRK